ncbi:hypothetical protein TanjilG_17005 [Lupinus angustifolius]|nr:hypothetical protein TanjilG_17005 [Lupinus angustifolius]
MEQLWQRRIEGYEFDDDHFHAYVHGRLPYEKLKPGLVLRNLLISMPQRKLVFTNADKAHAVKVLKRFGLEDCFEGIICFETLNPPKQINNHLNECFSSHSQILCKPSVEAFEAAIRIANVHPKKTVRLITYLKSDRGKITLLTLCVYLSSVICKKYASCDMNGYIISLFE